MHISRIKSLRRGALRTCAVLLSLFTLCSAGHVLADAKLTFPKITGGKPVEGDDTYPWMAALIDNSGGISFDSYLDQFCGGVLVADQWVLTAAHCVDDESSENPKLLLVGFGNDLNDPDEIVQVRRVYMFPGYRSAFIDGDFALLQLEDAVRRTPIVPLKKEEEAAMAAAGTIATALGWGDGEPAFPSELHEAELEIVSREDCNEAYQDLSEVPDFFPFEITERMICAGPGDNSAGVCNGDSGGPLVVRESESDPWKLAGLTSWGIPCDEDVDDTNYDVFSAVASAESWVAECVDSDGAKCPSLNVLGCWDGNANDACDLDPEDTNGDGFCTVLDCASSGVVSKPDDGGAGEQSEGEDEANEDSSATEGSLLRIADEARGQNCAQGGKRLELGLDDDGNGKLSDEEVDQVSYLCDEDGGGGCSTSNATRGPFQLLWFVVVLAGLRVRERTLRKRPS